MLQMLQDNKKWLVQLQTSGNSFGDQIIKLLVVDRAINRGLQATIEQNCEGSWEDIHKPRIMFRRYLNDIEILKNRLKEGTI